MANDLFDNDEFQDYAPQRGQVEETPSSIKLKKTSSDRELQVRQPLADRLRPQTFEDYVGQRHLIGEGKPLRQLIDSDRIPSMIFWGPPGTGKTTLASLIAKKTNSDFIVLSAVTTNIKEVRQVISNAKVNRQYARQTILFIDEIHRFNKAQQDAFLPHVESGLITLIGATTENPSFTVNSALLSRSRVFTLKELELEDIQKVLKRGLEDFQKFSPDHVEIDLPENSQKMLYRLCDGDARRALTMLESSCHVALHRAGVDHEIDSKEAKEDSESINVTVGTELIESIAQQQLLYDRDGEEHFNIISALHKTIRSSDPHAAAYWANRMLQGGEDPRYLIRRLIRMAGEDIGLADPRAVEQAIACQRAYETLGSPEGDLFITQLAVYLAMVPKSNAIYKTHNEVTQIIHETGTLPVPKHLRNAPTKVMKDEGYSDGYTYDHDSADHFIPKQGLPDKLDGKDLYNPTQMGTEKKIADRLKSLDEARKEHRSKKKK